MLGSVKIVVEMMMVVVVMAVVVVVVGIALVVITVPGINSSDCVIVLDCLW